MKKLLVIAPHPDDETLGCGGVLLRHRAAGDEIYWLLCTKMTEDLGFTQEQMQKQQDEINTVAQKYGFHGVFQLGFPSTKLDVVSRGELVDRISEVVKKTAPEIVFLPFESDVYSDHKIVFDAAISSTKGFRFPSVKMLLSYETVSETDYNLDPLARAFRPNFFVNIEPFLDEKITILNLYKDEVGEPPFPRSDKVVRALAEYRGGQSGCQAAEAFVLLKKVVV